MRSGGFFWPGGGPFAASRVAIRGIPRWMYFTASRVALRGIPRWMSFVLAQRTKSQVSAKLAYRLGQLR